MKYPPVHGACEPTSTFIALHFCGAYIAPGGNKKGFQVSGRFRNVIGNALLVLASVFFVFAGTEVYLRIDALLSDTTPTPFGTGIGVPADTLATAAASVPPVPLASGGTVPPDIVAAADARYRFTTMPTEWEHRNVSVSGAKYAYYWQGVLHVHDENNFRRATPFPPKNPNVFRVMVVGDSLTYGYGIPEQSTFTALLNKWLSKDYRVEFLNLGVSGHQSEDVLHEIQKFVPQLQPNLVIYAVCQNDFLPSGVGQYNGDQYAFPLPGRVKRFLIAHTKTGQFLYEKYDAALRGLHLRHDFFDDILTNFSDYQKRFARDVTEMNHTVTAAGLPPMLALVVDQFPSYGRGYQITRVAENALRNAGVEVVPTEDYYRRYNNQRLYVSNWEGHPNEVANYIWAKMIYQELNERKDLAAFKR